MQNKMMKRCLAALVAAILVGGVTVAVPSLIYAQDYLYSDDIGDAPRNIGHNDEVGTVTATAPLNENDGGDISTVDDGASVTYNYGLISDNFGTVSYNFGQIQYNCGTVINNYSETGILSNHDRHDLERIGTVVNQYYNVFFSGLGNNVTTTYDNNFTQVDKNELGYRIRSLQVTENGTPIENISGTITIAPSENYTISGEDSTNPANSKATYTCVRQENGSYVITITGLTGDVTISRAQLGLTINQIIEQNAEENEENVPNVVIRIDPSIQITEDESSNSRLIESAPAASNVITAAQISAMIESALAANPDTTVLDIDLGNDPSLTADSLIALCEKNNVAKRCHFTHNGMKFVLFVPVVDPTSATYQQCKVLLDAEPDKQAGPIRLSQLFAPVGFSLSGE